MQKPKRGLLRGFAAGFAVLVIAIGFGVKKVLTESADPTGDKDCPPLQPSESEAPLIDTTKADFGTLLWEQKGGVINDASCLDRTTVYGIVKVTTEDDVRSALTFARERKLKVSIAGVRHSMGGQAFARNAVVLDMRGFKKVSLSEEKRTITVQTGATWHDIQNFLHPLFAVKAMQSTDIFSVGGSIAVNAHGMDHRSGSVGDTIRSMRVMLPDGTIKTASRTENPELFRSVIGGYGLFGIVLDAEIDIVPNDIYETKRMIIPTEQFPSEFKNITANSRIGLMYSHLSTSPGSFLKEMIVYTYEKPETVPTDAAPGPLTEVASVKLRRLVINLSKRGPLFARLKWWSEKYLEPRIESCTVTRNQAMKDGEACLVSRNDPMHDSVRYLKNNLPKETDILHEYFIPRDQLPTYVDGMREILTRNHTNLLNASVRVAHKEDVLLNYAPTDMFSVVLYINQPATASGNEEMRKVTSELIDLTQSVGGRFFLPYQLHYTKEQLLASYPEFPEFVAAKKKIDPEGLLTNTWYERYGT